MRELHQTFHPSHHLSLQFSLSQLLRHHFQTTTWAPTHLRRRIHPRSDLHWPAVPQVRPDPVIVPAKWRWLADIPLSSIPCMFPVDEEWGGAASLVCVIRRAWRAIWGTDFRAWCGSRMRYVFWFCFLMYLLLRQFSVLVCPKYVMMTQLWGPYVMLNIIKFIYVYWMYENFYFRMYLLWVYFRLSYEFSFCALFQFLCSYLRLHFPKRCKAMMYFKKKNLL